MTVDQGLSFAVILGVMVLLVWDRIRYDVVAAAGLVVAVVAGIVPPERAFKGFGDDIVIIVGSALVVSAAVERSGMVDRLLKPLLERMDTTPKQVLGLTSAVAVLSAFMKNIGALAVFLPIAFQVARRTGTSPSRLLMPMSFAALLGGIATLIGTSPNVIVSRMRAELVGQPFSMFDFAPVGAVIAALGVTFLAFGWRLLPGNRRAVDRTMFSIADYTSEARLPASSPFVGKTVGELEAAADGEVAVTAIIREKSRRYIPAEHWVLYEDDVLVLECDASMLKRLVQVAKLELLADHEQFPTDHTAVVEAVVTEGSMLIGATAASLHLRDRFGVHVLAISRRGEPVGVRLRRARFQKGDLLVLMGDEGELRQVLATLGCLPLAERRLDLMPPKRAWIPIAILATAMTVAALEWTSVAVAFFGAAMAMMLSGAISLKEAYDRVDWPILILLGAMIPISESLSTTGGSELVASWLSMAGRELPPMAALGLVLVSAMLVTPFLNNAATVLLMAPIAVSLAQKLHQPADAYLMAVAIGAACDFLTPVGHQCNTLVMGPGGYRFSDYSRLGLPLSVLVVVVGTPLIAFVWG